MAMPNADIGQCTSQPLISQGTSPATMPGAITKKTALPTAALLSRDTTQPYVRTHSGIRPLGRQPVCVWRRPRAEDRLADSYGCRPVLDCEFQITGHAHGQLVIGARDVLTSL